MKWRPARYVNLHAIEVLNGKRDEFACPKKALMAARGYWYNDPKVGAVDESLRFSSRFAIENAKTEAVAVGGTYTDRCARLVARPDIKDQLVVVGGSE